MPSNTADIASKPATNTRRPRRQEAQKATSLVLRQKLKVRTRRLRTLHDSSGTRPGPGGYRRSTRTRTGKSKHGPWIDHNETKKLSKIIRLVGKNLTYFCLVMAEVDLAQSSRRWAASSASMSIAPPSSDQSNVTCPHLDCNC